MATGPDDLKTRRQGGFGLPLVVGQQTRDLEFLHRGEMEPVYCAAMDSARVAMLAQRRLEQRAWESAELEGLLVAQRDQLRLEISPARSRIFAAEIAGLELDERLEFGQHRD